MSIIDEKLFKRLPCDIVRENILPYTYLTQSKEHCQDIRDFVFTRNLLSMLYKYRWGDIDGEDELMWLENDIIRYMNNDIATMYNYTQGHMDKYRRLFMFHDTSDQVVYRFIDVIMNKRGDVFRCISTMLGVLTCNERCSLVSFVSQLDDMYYHYVLTYG